jgi:hypothetical protein
MRMFSLNERAVNRVSGKNTLYPMERLPSAWGSYVSYPRHPTRIPLILRSLCCYFAVGIANSAPFSVLSGQRCMMDFCFV